MKRYIHAQLATAALLFLSGNSLAEPVLSAQEVLADSSPGDQAIEVAGVRNPEWKPYRTLLLGVDAFENHRALSPGTTLRFSLRSFSPTSSMEGVTLRLESESESIPVQLDANYTFSLPQSQTASEAGAELLINRKKNTMTIRPDIRTPGLASNTRRLGDLRLECHVRWAIHKDELSFIKRNAFRMVGGPCNSGTVKTFYIADRNVTRAWLTAPGRTMPLEILNRGALFRPPLHDPTWSDDALVVLEFSDERAPGAQ